MFHLMHRRDIYALHAPLQEFQDEMFNTVFRDMIQYLQSSVDIHEDAGIPTATLVTGEQSPLPKYSLPLPLYLAADLCGHASLPYLAADLCEHLSLPRCEHEHALLCR